VRDKLQPGEYHFSGARITVNTKLREIMLKPRDDAAKTRKKHGGTMREAAFILAVGRLSEAMTTRGIM